MKTYRTLTEHPGLAAILPSGYESPISVLFVHMKLADTCMLCDPLSATSIILRFRAQKKYLDSWRKQYNADQVRTCPVRDNIEKEEVILVAPFPLTDPNLEYNLNLDQEFSQETLEIKQQETQSQLRQACYQEYLKTLFLHKLTG